MSVIANAARLLLRLSVFGPMAGAIVADYLFSDARRSLRKRADWLRRTAIFHAKWMSMKVRVHGEIPRDGLIVSNHISYVDIVALSAIGGFAFVAKKEVAEWPLFGSYARWGGSIFVNREMRGAVSAAIEDMRAHLREEIPTVLFPEGTSTSGESVLPFRSSLFDPVVKLECPVTACGLRYTLPGRSVRDEVAFWGDMDLAPHLWNLLQRTGLTLDIHFGPTRQRTGDRKTICREMHAEVCELAGLPAGVATGVGAEKL